MAISTSYSGQLTLELNLDATYSGDRVGSERARDKISVTFSAAGGTAPTISGFVSGTITVGTTPTDILLAHASDPFGTLGDARYSEGFTVAGSKVKVILIRNTHATSTLTVARKSSNGLPIFDAASDAVTLQAGGFIVLYIPTGTAALTTTSNDALTLTGSTAGVTAYIEVGYGP